MSAYIVRVWREGDPAPSVVYRVTVDAPDAEHAEMDAACIVVEDWDRREDWDGVCAAVERSAR